MDLLLINREKLKVILSEKDMEAYKISCEGLDYSNTETRRAFWSILDEAKHKTGFDAASDRVLIQVYPIKNGGCEIYVTKVPGLPSDKALSIIKKESGLNQTAVFEFSCISHLLKACAEYEKRYEGSLLKSSVWHSEGAYLLEIHQNPENEDNISLFYEFAHKIHKNVNKISEKYICICSENAVSIMAELA